MSQVAEVISEDRISALPEDLLVRILKLIPTKDAIATMILSKPWRYIWTMLPILDYEENNYNDDDDDDNDSDYYYYHHDDYSGISHKSIPELLHKAHALQRSLCIKLAPRCPTGANVGKWVAHAVSHSVNILRLKLGWSADPIRLPSSLYTSTTLVTLTLSNKILVDSPSSCCLPSLAVLELYYVMYKDEASLVSLLSSCPVLEILGVKRKKDDNVAKFSVKVPSLRELSYAHDNDNDVVEDTRRCLVIDTPRLQKIHITDHSGGSCSAENMPCLEEAYIDVGSFDAIDKFLTSFSSVSSLKLSLTSDLMFVSCSTIKFSRLTKCEISPRDSDWMDSLLPLLDNTPILKSLIIDYGSTHNPSAASLSWSDLPNYHTPKCLFRTLEEFEMIDCGGREEEQELVDYILSLAKILKTATIYLKSNFEPDQDKDKETMMEELNAVPRYSKTSQLLFVTNA